MQISRESWHFRVFDWHHTMKYGFHYVGGRVNLCPYCRTILFYSWARYLFRDGVIGKLPVPILTYGFLAIEIPRWVGMFSYTFKQALFAIELICVCVAIGGLLLMGMLALGFMAERKYAAVSLAGAAIRSVSKHGASFREVVVEYFTSIHNHICPAIEITNEQSAEPPSRMMD